MELEESYENIFDMEGVPQHPPFHGFSYGVLIVEDGRPMVCFTWMSGWIRSSSTL